jgi:hypothetical protein
MKIPQILGASVALLLVSAAGGHAATLTVQNPSFESPSTSTFAFGISNWSGDGTGQANFFAPNGYVQNNENASFTTAADGSQHAGQFAAGPAITQGLGVAFGPLSTYTITLAIGHRPAGIDGNGNSTGENLGGAAFGLRSADPVLGTINLGTPTTVDQSQVALGTFKDFTYTFTTGAVAPAGDVIVFFRGIAETDSQGQPITDANGNPVGRAYVDNYRVDVSPVPEPSTALCALIGGSLIIARRRRG